MDPSGSGGRAELRGIARRAMAERGLDPDFPPPVLAEVAALGERSAESGPGIRDLRGLAWASIDNSDTRDLDQLSVAEPGDGGVVKLLVAVADVEATVAPGSAIDAHAQLSTDLTSLGEGADRLAIVVDMAVSGDGAVQESDVYGALVKNQARLEYDSVAAWLDGREPAPRCRSCATTGAP